VYAGASRAQVCQALTVKDETQTPPAPAQDLPPAASLYLYRFRPLAPLMCAIAFVAVFASTGSVEVLRVIALLIVSSLMGLAYLLLSRMHSPMQVLRASIFVDALIIAALIGQLDRPEDLTVAFLWSIGTGSLFLGVRGTIAITIEAAALAVAVPLLKDGTTHDDPVILASNVIIFAVVGAVLWLARVEETNARRSLERSKRQLAEAQRVAQIGSWEWRPETGELRWSEEMYRLRGVDPADGPVSFSTYLKQLHPDEREEIETAIYRTVNERVPYNIDISFTRPNGEPGVIHARGAMITNEAGEEWMVGTAQDVTELRHVEQLKDQFAATASHELRTPATIIGGFAHTLDDRWDELDEPLRRELVGHIRKASDRLVRLIEDVLHVSRIESQKLRVEPEQFSLSELIETARAEHGTERIEVSIDDKAREMKVHADPQRQRQVLDNLLHNALRYSPDNAPVRIVLEAGEECAQVRVEDAGPGIPHADRERVFERFARLESGEAAPDGTGLGLYIARQLVELQGGRIWVTDAAKGGSSFCYTVPLKQD
jgi:signal transduction histidine kinase